MGKLSSHDTNDSGTKNGLAKGALMTGIANAIVNAGIQYFLLKQYTPVPITVDSITNDQHTVLGTAVPLVITLAMILTVVSWYKTGDRKVAFFPFVIGLILKHGFFTFGVITALAVLWQRVFGTIEVPLVPALILIGVVAGIVAGVIEYLTIRACRVRRFLVDSAPMKG